MTTIALVACTRRKHREAMQARDLYAASRWFQAARAYAEQHDAWYILSARYGLVFPEQQINPCQESLHSMSASRRHNWANRVWERLTHTNLPYDATFVLLAGRVYREPLMALIEWAGYTWQAPLARYGYARQIIRLQDLAEREVAA
jgi:hypothetical protein